LNSIPYVPTALSGRQLYAAKDWHPAFIWLHQAEFGFQKGGHAMEHIMAKLLQDFEQGKMTRRQLIQSLALASTVAAASAAPVAAADSKVTQAVYINHVSYQVADYAKTRDFYADLFGMKVSRDDGKQCRLSVGESLLVVRNASSRPSDTKGVDHIAYSIANWDTDKKVKEAVGAELKRRGLEVRETTGSFHVKDPDGFEVQMGGKDQ
jgi:catechol 2,3-dioxygenase-like lactoylglutathione lyase family enzyme